MKNEWEEGQSVSRAEGTRPLQDFRLVVFVG